MVNTRGCPGALLRTSRQKRPRQTGQPSSARAVREGLQMVIVCDTYPETQVCKEKFVSIQWVIGGLEEELPEEGSPPPPPPLPFYFFI